MRRIYTVGDVHGCAHELELLLEKIKPQANDLFIFLGDLVNRGPNSSKVLQIVRSLPHARCLLGNHEIRLLKFRKKQDQSFLKGYEQETVNSLMKSDWDFIETFEKTIYIREQNTLCVHAGFLPDQPWAKQSLSVITNIQVFDPSRNEWGKRAQLPKGKPWADYWKGPEFVIYGHTPRENIQTHPKALGIDTGCVYGGKLTAFELIYKKIIEIEAQKSHLKMK